MLLNPSDVKDTSILQSLPLGVLETLWKAPSCKTIIGSRDRALIVLVIRSGVDPTFIARLNREHWNGTNIVVGEQSPIIYLRERLRTYVEKRDNEYGHDRSHPLFLTAKGERFTRCVIPNMISMHAKKIGITVPVSPLILHAAYRFHVPK